MSFKSILSNFTKGDDSGSSGNVIQIGDNNYIFDVYLHNGETKMGITYATIEELKIVDDLRYFFSYGYMVFNDSHDTIESFNGADGTNKVKPYNFRGDGRDYLQVEIMPQIKPDDTEVSDISEKDREEFCIKYTFSIYKIEEEMMEEGGLKYKRLYFWDVDYQILNEIDSHFSSSEVPVKDIASNTTQTAEKGSSTLSTKTTAEKKVKNTDDFKRYTGDIIKTLLDKCLNKLTNSNLFKASSEWDRGGALLEYHTNAGFKAIDDLEYLLHYHVSDKEYDYVPCILKKIRYKEEYSFIPITVYLQNTTLKGGGGLIGGLASLIGLGGGRGLNEDFYIGKPDSEGSGMGSILNFGSPNSQNSFNAINYNIIENYSFLKADADIVQKDISTHFVHSYDPSGFFTCSIKSNNFKNSTKSIFNDNVKNFSNSPNSQIYDILPKNQLREDNKNVQHVYTSGLGIGQQFQKLNFGRNKALMASIFKNNAIYFRVRGLTRRKSGTFFTINRRDNQLENENDKNLLGKYFATMVIHEFKKGTYYNHIYGTKPTSSEKQSFASMI